MTTEINAAAERVTTARNGGFDVAYPQPNHWPEARRESTARIAYLTDVEKLSFAEHDPTPVTKDWLISIGFHEGDHFIFGINNGDYENAINGHFWSNPPVHFVLRAGDMDVTEYATRGQVRSLCRVLGIVINERN